MKLFAGKSIIKDYHTKLYKSTVDSKGLNFIDLQNTYSMKFFILISNFQFIRISFSQESSHDLVLTYHSLSLNKHCKEKSKTFQKFLFFNK